MSIILKILQKSDPSYQNYQPLIEHASPVLFTVDKDNNTFIGFVNVYRPTRGQIAVTLSETTSNAVQNLIQTNGKLNNLFPNGVHYSYDKRKLSKTVLTETTLDSHVPHKSVRFNDFPNRLTY